METRALIGAQSGLLADESGRVRRIVFAVLLLVAGSMTFTQLGFVGLGVRWETFAYLMALLAPIAVTALLLGGASGLLMGLACGAILLAHARLQPLDPMEAYLITPKNSVLLYAAAGLVLGLLFEAIKRRGLTGSRRRLAIAIACACVSVLVTDLFDRVAQGQDATYEQLKVYAYSGDLIIQAIGDAVLMAVGCIVADAFLRHHDDTKGYVSVQNVFRTNLLAALVLAYLMVSSVVFSIVTMQERAAAHDDMDLEISFVSDQLTDRWDAMEYLFSLMEGGRLDVDDLDKVMRRVDPQRLIAGYDSDDGTLLVISAGMVMFSNDPMFEPGGEVGKGLDMETVERAAREGTLCRVLYDKGETRLQLGYLRAVDAMDETYVVMAKPYSAVFAHRQEAILWTSVATIVLLAMVYVMVALLMRRVVMDPINGTNRSLDKIMEGDLDEMVREVSSVEFASLSAGINATVDALKSLIDEAERRMEADLATGRAIQEGALPRRFPAFPGVDAVDLYASMDAAKEVGGDFYDFFEVDDHTVAFLVADVSGKGIPGALFMMSAKTEIQSRLSSGMEPAHAMAAANAYLCANNEADMFVTVWAATLDWRTGRLTYVNAGHNSPLLRRGHGGSWEWLTKRCGLFLGTFEMARYRQETLTLEPGDELLLYTDGVNEAFDVDEAQYGNDRLEAFLSTHADERPRSLVQALRSDVAAWAEGAEQSDDVTILVVEYDA